MLKQQSRLLTIIAICLDICSLLLAFVLAYILRSCQVKQLEPIHHYIWILLVMVPTWYFLLARFGVYASLRTRSTWSLIAVLAKVHMVGAVIVAASVYLVTPYDFSRWFFFFTISSSFVLLLMVKVSLKLLLSFIRIRGRNVRQLVIVGYSAKAERLVQLIHEHALWGLRIVGVFAYAIPEKEQLPTTLLGYPCLGSNGDSLLAFCKANPVDEVIFCQSNDSGKPTDSLLADLETVGVTARVIFDVYQSQNFRAELDIFHNELPMVTYCSKAFSADQLFLKRLLDIVGSLVGLAITASMLPFVALAIKLEDPGPLFFGQNRVGLNRRIFKCWKFRSMFLDAEDRKKELMAQNEMKGAMFKMKDDPRVTRVGKFIRKTSIDELPQFWNVLQGDMSLVGTRPPTPDEVATYENWHLRRVSIKPGITGLWQVSGRNQIQDFDDVVRLDLQYIDTWTIWQDVKILLKTIWVVFAGRGAR